MCAYYLFSDDVQSYDDDDECNICEGNDESPAARCGRGEHDLVLDEEIGILCKYCLSVLLEIKHVLPPFVSLSTLSFHHQYQYQYQ